MHWVLTVSNSFSLTKVIRRSEQFLYPPFRVDGNDRNLYRVEQLSTGHTIEFRVTQSSTGLVIHTDARLNGKETEEVTQKTWRMLRIGENLQPFLDKAHNTPALSSVTQLGGQVLRGATAFEDIVKALMLTHQTTKKHGQSIAWLVDQFGDALPSNPTLHAFPNPKQLEQQPDLKQNVLGSVLAEQLTKIARKFQTQKDQIEALINAHLPLQSFQTNFQQTLGLDEETTGLAMLYLGRYDYIPVDQCAQQRVSDYLHIGQQANPDEVRALFATWQPWGGLAYWLWDWSTAKSSCDPFENEVRYGELESQHRAS